MLTHLQTLGLLLEHERIEPNHLDWAELRRVATAEGVIVRLSDALTACGEALPPRFGNAAADACGAAQRELEIVNRLGARCTALGMPHAFLRTVENHPDGSRGRITLLVGVSAAHTPGIDRTILRDVPAAERHGGATLERRIAGVSAYVAVYGIRVHIRHGRIGRLGEHARYARLLLERARPVVAGHVACRAPSVEDHLLLLAIDRAYMRPAFRLADLAWTIPVLRTQGLNWDYIFATALSIGMLPGVGTFLAYVNGIHRQIFARDVVDTTVVQRFQGFPASATTQFPAAGAIARTYAHNVEATLESGRWHSVARLALLPFIAALARTRRSL
ncbi:MAG: hypothetical protein ABR537_11155 [Gemmatimonadales bacterium]